MPDFVVYIAIGLFAGALSGLIGIGGIVVYTVRNRRKEKLS